MQGKTPQTEQAQQPAQPLQQSSGDQVQPMPFAEGLERFSPRDGVQAKMESGPTEEAAPPPPDKGGDEKEDLGKLDSLGKKFQKTAGKIAEKVARHPGSTGKIQVFVNIPVAAGGLVCANMRFMGSVAQGDSGKYTVRAEVGGGVSAGKEVDLYFATVKAFAAAQVFGYLEAQGDSGEECFRLMSLSIHDRLAKVSKKVANALFGAETIEDALEDMDEEDYVEAGLGASLVAGAGAETETGQAVGGWAVGSKTKGEKVSKGEDGKLKKEKKKAVSVGLGSWFAPFRLGGTLTAKWTDDELSDMSAELTGVAMMSIGDINQKIAGGTLIPELATSLSTGITSQAKALGNAAAIKKAAGLSKHVAGKTGLAVGVESGTSRAIESLNAKYMGLQIGMALTVACTWSKSGGYKFSVKLEKQTRFDVGSGLRDPGLFVRLESMQKIFAVES